MSRLRYNCSGYVLFRFCRFQIELWICPKYTIIPPHIHPDMDSYIIHVWGRTLFTRDGRGKFMKLWTWLESHFVPARVVHGFQNMNNRLVFINVEKWYGIKPTSAAINLEEI